MEWVALLLAMLLPLFAGAACTGQLIQPRTQGRGAIVWGNGMLLGLLITPLVMRLQDKLGLSLAFPVTATGLGILLLLALVAARICVRLPAVPAMSDAQQISLSPAQKTLFLLFAVLIGLRVLSLGMELLWRPLFAWDATMHWATKARVWFAAGSIVPFVENERWLEMAGAGVFTDHHPGYPITVPLLQVWMSSAVGRWDESIINLPWLLCLMGLGTAFYGQSRFAGATPVAAIVFTYMLLSMPLLNTHVALAGYGDLFMGACYCAAIMAFHNWSVTRRTGQGVLALLFILCCPLIKNEGLYWALTFVPALFVMFMPSRRYILLFAVTALSSFAFLLLSPPDLVVAGHSLQGLDFHYRPGALDGLLASFGVQDNWHLLAYLLPGLALLYLLSGGTRNKQYAPVFTALLTAVSLLATLFLFSRFAGNTDRFTAVGRISMHLVPSLMFSSVLLWYQLSTQLGSAPPRRAGTPGEVGQMEP